MAIEMTERGRDAQLSQAVTMSEAYKRQITDLATRIQVLDNSTQDIDTTVEALNALNQNKPGTEIFVPIGRYIVTLMRAELKDNEKVIINIGGNVSAEKTLSEAKEILKSRKDALTTARQEFVQAFSETQNRLSQANEIAQRLVQELQNEKP
jgi:prefoldin alpha subunit